MLARHRNLIFGRRQGKWGGEALISAGVSTSNNKVIYFLFVFSQPAPVIRKVQYPAALRQGHVSVDLM